MNRLEALKTVGGVVLGVAGIAICVGFLFVSDLEATRRELIDPISLCPASRSVKVWNLYEIHPPKVPRNVAIVVDATDNIPPMQRDEIIRWFQRNGDFASSLMRFERVRIYELNDEAVDESPRFEACAPPSEANPWIENPREIRRTFEEDFLDRLTKVIASLAERPEGRYSPLLEIVANTFDSHDRVILVSDLMHHVQEFSLYRSAQQRHNYEAFLQTSYAETMTSAMDEKELVVIHLIRRKLSSLQNESLSAFWRTHLERNGGQMHVALTPSAIE